jgi:hypothetical protein
VVSSSSTKKAARLAQKGKGKKVRFQGGTLFPLVVLGVLVAGLALIVYARVSRPAADASPPTIDDHWHVAYGFDLCDYDTPQQLTGNKEQVDSTGRLVSTEYLRTGVHSHDDGVIHWHATTSASTGHNADLGVFLDVYGVDLSNDELKFPDDQLGGKEYVEGETTCLVDGKEEDGTLVVAVWDNFTDTGDPTVYTSDFRNIRVDQNSMVMVVAFIPESMDPRDIEMPSWAAELPALGALDQVPADIGPDGSTPLVPAGTTPDGTATDGTATDGTATEATTAGSAPDATGGPTTVAPTTTGG